LGTTSYEVKITSSSPSFLLCGYVKKKKSSRKIRV
jgi:hypothetical protein